MKLEDIDLKVGLSSYTIYVRIEYDIIKTLRRSISVFDVMYRFSRITPRGNMSYMVKSDKYDAIHDMGEFITFKGDISDRFISVAELYFDVYMKLYTRFKI